MTQFALASLPVLNTARENGMGASITQQKCGLDFLFIDSFRSSQSLRHTFPLQSYPWPMYPVPAWPSRLRAEVEDSSLMCLVLSWCVNAAEQMAEGKAAATPTPSLLYLRDNSRARQRASVLECQPEAIKGKSLISMA